MERQLMQALLENKLICILADAEKHKLDFYEALKAAEKNHILKKWQ